ncbi:MAG: FAD-dependent monooxygenase, partial [Saccharospirillaceae bacterium]|nr:FAD-dependent monooxygenase [Saccharospirillaceae bacterium]
MNYDVVIVGAGLVGQAIATALAQGAQNKSLRIALIDPAFHNHEPASGSELADYDLRVSALTAKTQAFLTRLGAWQNIPPQRLSPYTGMHVWDAEGTGSVTFDAADLHAPCLGHIVENRQTLWAIQQCLKEMQGVDVITRNVRYLDNRNAEGYTPVVLENDDRLLAKLVIGADGALSRVRQWAGLPTTEWDYGHHAIVATVRLEQPLQATAWQRFRPKALALLPLPGDEHLASIVWSTSPAEADAVLAMDEAGF